ncbi:MAG: GIY-YIG nuclease family protein [Peptoniphilus sp.]|nr:GIY-YIG nuclease family protein [Peptoniphilus sp.]
MPAYVYILKCNDDTLYTGYTTNIKNRIKMHNLKKASKYTRGRTPVKLVYLETLSSKSEALRREYAIKQLSKEQKLKLINSQSQLKSF